MPPTTELAGTDAAAYELWGRICAEQGNCWNPGRPIGAVLYFSLPFRLGLPFGTIVLLNWILVLGSTALVARLVWELTPGARYLRIAACAMASVAAHILFLAGLASYPLSDAPAASLALGGLVLLLLGRQVQNTRLTALAGLVLGSATVVRAYYLYPAIAAAAVTLLDPSFRRAQKVRAWFLAMMALPLALQVAMTFRKCGAVAFLDPKITAEWRQVHLSLPLSGYDTLLPARGLRYDVSNRLGTPTGLPELSRRGDMRSAAVLIGSRLYHYFGSYVPFGNPFLREARDRIFSPLIAIGHACALLLAAVGVWRSPLRRLMLPALVFLAATLAQGLVIVPESRFLAVLHIAVWSMVPAAMPMRKPSAAPAIDALERSSDSGRNSRGRGRGSAAQR